MPVVPDKINDKIAFFEQRIQTWLVNRNQIGLTQDQVEDFSTLIMQSRSAFNTAAAARVAAKNATVGQTATVRNMGNQGSDLIRFIRAFAESKATPEERDAVYQAASLPPPAPPTPAGVPLAPTDVSGDPNADGTVTIRWKGSTANQTFFSIWRRVGNNTTWTQIGSVAVKSFIDTTVPGGTPSVRYYVRAQRNNQVSPASDETVVNFGISMAA